MIKNHHQCVNYPQAEWTAPPRAPTPDGMIYCKILMSNIPICKMQKQCRVKSCKAKEAHHGH